MFKSDKTKEQLTFESKQKSQNMLNKAADLLEKVARKRDTEPSIKVFCKSSSEAIRTAANTVGPVGVTPPAVAQQPQ